MKIMRYVSLAIIVFAMAIVANAQATFTEKANYGLHYIPYGNSIRVTMEDPRLGQRTRPRNLR